MNGEQMREKCFEWEKHCSDVAVFHYPTAPLPFDGHDLIVADALGLPVHSNMRRWASTWTPSREFIQNFVDNQVASAIDVILGFSQGVLIGVKILNESWDTLHLRNLKAAIFIASPKMKVALKTGGLPTLHIVGVNDEIVDVEESKKLAAGFTSATIVEHPGRHMDFPSEAKSSIRTLLELVSSQADQSDSQELSGECAAEKEDPPPTQMHAEETAAAAESVTPSADAGGYAPGFGAMSDLERELKCTQWAAVGLGATAILTAVIISRRWR
jgi:hypothetical protein